MLCETLLCISLSGASLTHAAGSLDNLIYICPTAGSEWQSTGACIILGFEDRVPGQLVITVNGSVSGPVSFSRYVSEDGRRLVLTPDQPFIHGEDVFVQAESPGSGRVEWSFSVRPVDPPLLLQLPVEPEYSGQASTPDPYPLDPAGDSPNAVTLPSDFPLFTFNTYGATAPGNLFFSPMNPVGGSTSTYLISANTAGEVLFYKNGDLNFFGPEVHSDGKLYYAYGGVETIFAVLDENYAPVDSFMVVGYPTDCHGLTVAQNDNVLLLGADLRYIDMSLVVPGGNPNALVQGLLIQEQDRNHMPVFQWSSFDHFEITDACSYVNLTGSFVDYVHCNSIDEDRNDGGILVSCLAMTECTKIDRSTGELVWRFGGYLSENPSFTILNDPLGGFSSQHDFRHVEDNLYSVFDNGSHHSPQISRASIYELDTQDLTADLVFNFQVSGLYGSHMGSTQVLPNGNVLVGWGDVTGYQVRPDMTEVTPSGVQVFRGRLNQLVLENYRAYRFDWEGQALVPYLVALVLTAQNCVQLTYNVFGETEYSSYDIYQGTTPSNLSFLLNTTNRQINVWELPVGMNYFAVKARDMQGVPTEFSNIDSALVTWTALEDRYMTEVPQSTGVAAYPNPAVSGVTVIWPGTPTGAVVELFDVSGRIVPSSRQVSEPGVCSAVLSVEDLPTGLYVVKVSADGFEGSTRLIVIR